MPGTAPGRAAGGFLFVAGARWEPCPAALCCPGPAASPGTASCSSPVPSLPCPALPSSSVSARAERGGRGAGVGAAVRKGF